MPWDKAFRRTGVIGASWTADAATTSSGRRVCRGARWAESRGVTGRRWALFDPWTAERFL
jgi:hypothetical protein